MGKTESKKEDLNIGVMIICIIGVVLTVLGSLLVRDNNLKLNIIKAEGTVTGVKTSTDANGNVAAVSVNLSYNANRADYTATVDTSRTDLKVGDKMDLYYDFFTPTSVRTSRFGYQGYIALIIGLILVLKTGPRFFRIIRDNYL